MSFRLTPSVRSRYLPDSVIKTVQTQHLKLLDKHDVHRKTTAFIKDLTRTRRASVNKMLLYSLSFPLVLKIQGDPTILDKMAPTNQSDRCFPSQRDFLNDDHRKNPLFCVKTKIRKTVKNYLFRNNGVSTRLVFSSTWRSLVRFLVKYLSRSFA